MSVLLSTHAVTSSLPVLRNIAPPTQRLAGVNVSHLLIGRLSLFSQHCNSAGQTVAEHMVSNVVIFYELLQMKLRTFQSHY